MGKKNRVLIGGRSPVTRDSEGTVTAFPNVCNTPAPNGQVPVPYASVARSADLEKGSRSVTIEGAAVCLSDSELARSTGDEPGTGGGLMSGQRGGPAHPVTWDMTVRIEGKPVVRNLNLFTSNGRNTAPFPIVQQQEAPPVAGTVDELEEEKCPYCGKAKHDFGFRFGGTNIGISGLLRSHLLRGEEIARHPWYAGPRSLAAHHLICAEAMNNDKWRNFCLLFGFDINCLENGAMLPMLLELACQLLVPLHRGDHSAGFAYDLHLPYPNAVKRLLRDVAGDIERGIYCENPQTLVDELHNISRQIAERLASFSWTITRDGLDYGPGGNGCAGVGRIPDKPQRPCPCGRVHGIVHESTGALLLPGVRTLRAGE
ncbi:PAAR-like domain-containing protein [Archangium sp.]|uniref:PAAR-like domain-containing protein n=1 Tax=Archangium sp. TaxID=1872627 RepID=UPI002D2753A6|nr:PAAR-like domain-containing protein [Archangium sp.]HYO60236.1 PAAR-like domain-containing protein [Archangium sp.]